MVTLGKFHDHWLWFNARWRIILLSSGLVMANGYKNLPKGLFQVTDFTYNLVYFISCHKKFGKLSSDFKLSILILDHYKVYCRTILCSSDSGTEVLLIIRVLSTWMQKPGDHQRSMPASGWDRQPAVILAPIGLSFGVKAGVRLAML